MKRLILVVAFLFIGATIYFTNFSEVLTNGSFENWTSGNPDNWTVIANDGDNTVTQYTAVTWDGSSALRFQTGAANTGGNDGIYQTGRSFSQNYIYKYTFRAYNNTASAKNVRFYYFRSAGSLYYIIPSGLTTTLTYNTVSANSWLDLTVFDKHPDIDGTAYYVYAKIAEVNADVIFDGFSVKNTGFFVVGSPTLKKDGLGLTASDQSNYIAKSFTSNGSYYTVVGSFKGSGTAVIAVKTALNVISGASIELTSNYQTHRIELGYLSAGTDTLMIYGATMSDVVYIKSLQFQDKLKNEYSGWKRW